MTTETKIWDDIANDAPRRWTVTVDGRWFADESSTAATILADVERWLVDALVWEMNYGTFVKRINVYCPSTEERMSKVLRVTVTPSTGVSTME